MLKPKNYSGVIPPETRYIYNGRTYWLAHFPGGIWCVTPDDDAPSLISGGNWEYAIREYEYR